MNNMKIQVLIPEGGYYGGIESLHQLCSLGLELNLDISCVYIPIRKYFRSKQNLNLSHYKIKIEKDILDKKNVAIICPETFTNYLSQIKFAKKIIWWLSKDNFFKKKKTHNQLSSNFFYFLYKRINHYTPPLSLSMIKKENIINLCQSSYVYSFLKKNKVKNLYYLFDYIYTYSNKKIKKNIDIILNSQKGNLFNNAFYKEFNDIFNIRILKNLSLRECDFIQKQSKFFIDFGHSPGRDRIPREAVLNKLNILVRNKGAASNKTDLNIDKFFKFNSNNTTDFCQIVFKIIILNNFENKKPYSNYIKSIINDKNKMKKNILSLNKIINEKN
jgi:hypothetical protein